MAVCCVRSFQEEIRRAEEGMSRFLWGDVEKAKRERRASVMR